MRRIPGRITAGEWAALSVSPDSPAGTGDVLMKHAADGRVNVTMLVLVFVDQHEYSHRWLLDRLDAAASGSDG